MPSIFSYESAEVDWCESNFVRSAVIAEYYNTVSASGRLGLLCHLKVPLLLAGLFSMYFHMTLSYVGQLLDELSILWTLAVAYSFWYPQAYFPKCIKTRRHFFWLTGITTVISTLMSFVKPTLNAYALNSQLTELCQDLPVGTNLQDTHSLQPSWDLWGLHPQGNHAMTLCPTHNFVFLGRHVLIALSLLYCCPLVIYFDVSYEMPSFKPKLEYWPSDSWPVVVPYVTLEEPHKQC
uniref:Alkaline ceramidase n=1 Tax=Geospiza parvula TaxID=87175 RepID=A0A8C3MPY4_GEOPR